jgi:hypothetical protein
MRPLESLALYKSFNTLWGRGRVDKNRCVFLTNSLFCIVQEVMRYRGDPGVQTDILS